MRAPLRIAVLECATLPEKTKRRYNSYGEIFRALFTASAKALNQPERLDPDSGLDFSYWDVVNNDRYPRLENIDAVLLTGSGYNSFDDVPWINRLVEFTKKVLAQDRVRLLGVCFGHQIVGRVLGAKVGRNDKGWEISVCDVQLTEKGKELFERETLRIQQMHQDIVFNYPPDITSLGSSPRCTVQGMYASGRFVTIQGHPEFTEDIVTEILQTRAELGVFDQAQAQEALGRAGNEHDGVVIGAAFLRFLLDDQVGGEA